MSERKFKFTPEQLAFFRENGYIGPLDLYEAEFIKEKYRDIRADIFDRANCAYNLPHNSLLAGYDRHLDIEFFTKHISQPRIVDKVQDILGPDLLCWRSEMFPKYPGDEGTDWHQADTFAHASGAPQIVWPGSSDFGGAITVWTALTDVTEANGCLRFIPGTHEEMFYDETKDMKYSPEMVNNLQKNGIKRGFFGYDYRNLQKDPNFVPDESKAVSIEMKAGQCVIFWSTLMHASYPNSTTDQTRLAVTARYVPTSCQVYPGTDTVEEYGSILSLDKYGVVLVAGEDNFKHNKVITENLRGVPFK
ncbi:chemotaxis protein CheX [Rheinheimera sp. SA_1]|uniref:chlorinating enzyme n=1 Tax=Rheinheimera sp. SA_1 TaxID=1827365 RepID=UPI0007FC9C19|nr:chlorinating enzyme [Rheinheimera sp. SA_1]OBP13470.1 chemotaxis protein CheX [Rheinheimera sp. SA_1]